MKKILLLIAAIALGAGPALADTQPVKMKELSRVKAHADELEPTDGTQLVFGYTDDLYTGIGPGSKQTSKVALLVPSSISGLWVGNKITRLNIGFGSTTAANPEIEIFITNTLNGTPIYSQKVTMENKNSWNSITLETPVEITEAKNLYIGYSYDCVAGDYPFGIDYEPTENTNTLFFFVNNQWQNLSTSYGSLSLQALIEGESLPQNRAAATGITLPICTFPNTPFTATVSYINEGVQPITSMNLAVTVDGKPVANPEYTLSPAATGSYQSGVITVKGLTADNQICNVPVEVTIAGVNLADNENTESNSQSLDIACMAEDKAYSRKFVVEEWTGTWCGWCPRGIVGMNYMSETYGDKDFIGVAIHSNDAMEASTFSGFLNKYASGFPNCIINRNIITDPNQAALVNYYRQYAGTPTFVDVAVTDVNFDSAKKQITASAEATFAVPVVEGDFRIVFEVIEDEVGPYNQENYYSPDPPYNNKTQKLEGWDKEGVKVSTIFNEVARATNNWAGVKGSVPANLEADTPTAYSANLSSRFVKNIDNCTIVALVVNGVTGEIVNATKMKYETTGVEDAMAEGGVAIYGEPGAVVVRGEYASCVVYGIDGRVAATGSGAERIAVDGGIYIVKAIGLDGKAVVKKVAAGK